MCEYPRVRTPDRKQIGHLAHILERGGERGEHLVCDIGDRERPDDVLECALLQLLQIELFRRRRGSARITDALPSNDSDTYCLQVCRRLSQSMAGACRWRCSAPTVRSTRVANARVRVQWLSCSRLSGDWGAG